jgi:ketosteroid isomerase-like protein
MTQEALATSASCDVKTIRTAEKNGRLDASTVKRIADAMGLSLAAIVLDQDDPSPHDNAQIFHRWQAAFNDRNVDALVEHYLEDATLAIPGADDLPGGGTFHGADSIRQHFLRSFDTFEVDRLTAEDYRIDAVGDYVFARGTPSATIKGTGRRFMAAELNELEIRDGKIYRHTVIVDTAPMRRCLTCQPLRPSTGT